MSMLAEPRRKQRVFNLRAKNSAWSNDSDKFGQKMLEKMGWSAGKGLGAREDGVVEHVLARYKNDSAGLGFEDRNDQWTKNEQDFEGLLRSLSGETGDNDTIHKPTSLEEKSKKSSSRVHYHKFTRGKDLTKYSEKDLANIFGKKSLKEKPKPPEIKEVEVKEEKNETGQLFTTKGTMADYFKALKKMGTNMEYDDTTFEPSKKRKKKTSSKDDDENDFAFNGFLQVESVDEKIERSELFEPVRKSSKKKKKNRYRDDAVSEEYNGFSQLDSVESIDENIERSELSEPVSKSSKKKKKNRCRDDAVKEEYNGFSQLDSVKDKIESGVGCKLSKKLKKIIPVDVSEGVNYEVDTVSKLRKKTKKDKIICEQAVDDRDTNIYKKKQKKNKKRKQLKLESEDNAFTVPVDSEENSLEKSKKKKKRKSVIF